MLPHSPSRATSSGDDHPSVVAADGCRPSPSRRGAPREPPLLPARPSAVPTSRAPARHRAVLLVAVLTALPACGTGDPAVAGGVRTLAKVDGWRDGQPFPAEAFALFEVAADDDAARALWDAAVPDGLPARDGDPREVGLYGDLSDVDLDEQVLALWSSGESGSCPGWLAGVGTSADGALLSCDDDKHSPTGGCSDDDVAYRTVVAVDRSGLPDLADLAAVEATVDGLRVRVGAFPLG